MKRYYYKFVIENGQKTFKYIDNGLTDEELSLSQKLDNIILTAERLMRMHRIMVDSFLKLKQVNFQKLRRAGDTDQINELVINFISNAKLFIDYLDRRWAPKYISKFNKKWKTQCSAFYDRNESYRLCYHLRNFVQHSGALPIKQVIETPGSDRSKVNTILVLNIGAFKDFKKEFAKANIADSYWEDANNLSFMKHANAYVVQLIALYRSALAEYIKANKAILDKIQAKMKDTALCSTILWSNTSPQDVPNAKKQNNFTLYPIVTLTDLSRFYRMLAAEKIVGIER